MPGPGGFGRGMGGGAFAGGSPHTGVTRSNTGHANDADPDDDFEEEIPMTHDFLADTYVRRKAYSLAVLALIMTSGVVFSNILGAKVWHLGPIVLDGGVILFPLVWTAQDIMVQVFYHKTANFFLGWTAAMNIVAMLAMLVCTNMFPAVPGMENPDFSVAFGLSARVFIASSVGYLVRGHINNGIFDRMRTITDEDKGIVARAFTSSLVGRVFDSVLFTVIAFAGRGSLTVFLQQTFYSFLVATGLELLFSFLVTAPVSRWLNKFLTNPNERPDEASEPSP